MGAEQPFVQETVRSKARQAILPQVERRHRNERRHEMFERVEAAVVGNMRPNVDDPLIDARLNPNRGFFDHIARPAGNRIVAFQPDVERAADVPLRRRRKSRKFLDFRNRQITGCRSRTRRHGRAPARRPGSHPPGGLQLCNLPLNWLAAG